MKEKFVSEKCPVCETGKWLPKSDDIYEFSYARKKYQVSGLHYAQCNECKTRGYLPGQRKENQRLIREFQKTLAGYISPSDILALREKYLLTQKQANIIFGGGSQGFSKWERGISNPAGPTARLIKLALNFPIVMETLAREVGIQLDTPIITATQQPVVMVFHQTHWATGNAEDYFSNYHSSDDEEDEHSWQPAEKRTSRKHTACLN